MNYPIHWLRRLMLSSALAVPLLALAANTGDAASYAVRIPVTPAPGAPLQRLVLPAQALVRLQAPGYADLRIFNADGQAVPMALASVAAPAAARQQVRLAAYPILGAASAGGGLDGLSLRIEERQGKRVVEVNAPASHAPTAQKVLGALLDARAVTLPVASMVFDVDLPAGQPVSFSVQSSKDLDTWQPLAGAVLYRADAAGAPGELGNSTLNLAMADLKGRYLRITWGDAAVNLRGATLATSQSSGAQRVSAAMARPALASAHEFGFALPFATPLAALKISAQGSNVLVPVRVLGRNDRSQPWGLLASTVVYRLISAGKDQPGEQVNGPVELQGAAVREIKIEADAKTAGFAAAPDIALQFEPAQLVFLASGPAPFTLAAGLAGGVGAASPYLPMASLIPGYQALQENTLPLAQADIARMQGGSAGLVAAQAISDGVPTRSLVLWGVLLAGALALGLMAWALLKQTRSGPAQ